ncbi:hypothetical protein Q9Q99_07895 [Curtobacterium flaccumfaciens]|nr:hypothetical protein Q9Q99_07895 [Curtobacterium flaccumfaciens]
MSIASVLRDGRVIARRNMLGVRRTPGALVTGVAQPIIFVLILGVRVRRRTRRR